MRKFLKGPFLFMGMNLLVLPLLARDFYVDPERGNINNPGTADSPWSTLEDVFTANKIKSREYSQHPPQSNTPFIVKNPSGVVQAGDTLILRAGHHGKIQEYAYFNEDYITIRGAEGERATLGYFELNSGAKWKLQNLYISPETLPAPVNRTLVWFNSHGWHGDSYDCIVESCTLTSKWDASAWTRDDWSAYSCNGIALGGVDMVARGNYLRNVNFAISGGTYNHVIGNVIDHFSGDGIRAWDHTVVEYNVIKNLVFLDYGELSNHPDGFQSWSSGSGGVGTGEVVGTVLRGNLFINTEDPTEPFQGNLQGIGCFDGMFRDWIVENNVVLTNHYHGISLYGAIHCRIVNNTVFNPYATPGSDISPWITAPAHKNGTPSSGNVLRNNIYHRSIGGGPTDTVDHNVKVSTGFADLFVDIAHFDSHLKPEAHSLIDQGLCSDSPPQDRDFVTRPQGSGCDVGAYEYAAAPAATLLWVFPPAGSAVSGTATLKAEAPSGIHLTQMEYWVDGSLLGVSTSPFSQTWVTAGLPEGHHTLQARASLVGGGTAVTPLVTLRVLNHPSASETDGWGPVYLHPQPASTVGHLHMESLEMDHATVRFYSGTGRLLTEIAVSSWQPWGASRLFQATVDVGDWPSGTYLYHVEGFRADGTTLPLKKGLMAVLR